MKKLIFIFLLALFTNILSSIAQNVVTYDFKTNSFDKTIPFDELITFKFINIPLIQDRSFVFECTQINKMNKDGENLLNKYLDKSRYTADSTVSFVSTKYFPPNKDFIFEISFVEERNLTHNEKNELISEIIKTEIISKQLINLHAFVLEDRFQELGEMTELTFSRIKESVDSLAMTMFRDNIDFSDKNEDIIKQMNYVYDLSTLLASLFDDVKFLKMNSYFIEDTTGYYKEVLDNLEHNIRLIEFFPFRNLNSVESILNNNLKYDSLSLFEDIVVSWNEIMEYKSNYSLEFPQKLIADAIIEQMRMVEFSSQSYPKGLVEQSRNYIAADLGVSYTPTLDKFTYFTTASIYFRPVKRSIPLNRYEGWDILKTRLCVDVGITLNSIEVENEIKGSMGTNKGFLLGGGFRILSFLKLNSGIIVYKAKDMNPLVNTYHNKCSWYIGASIDLSVSALFKENFSGKTNSK